jgi:prophage regulatory protein
MKILRRMAVCEKLGIAIQKTYDLGNPKSARFDPTFPSPIKIGNGRAVGFVEEEIDAWLAKQVLASRAERKTEQAVAA